MKGQGLTIALVSLVLLIADAYFISGIRGALKKWKFSHTKAFTIIYWIVNVLLITGVLLSIYVKLSVGMRAAFMFAFFVIVILKATFLLFMLADDIRRLFVRVKNRNKKPEPTPAIVDKNAIPRSEILMKA